MPLWPFVERVPLGEWELRIDPAPVGRLLKRANSCLALGDPGLPVRRGGRRPCGGFYRARDRTPLVQVELGSDTERAFVDLGWTAVPGR